MNSRALSIVNRQIWPSPRTLTSRAPALRRFASSDRQPSNVAVFYKTFTRPVAKVLLMAVFTYQLAYWGWVKLEQDEIRADREAEIVALESAVAWMTRDDALKIQTLGNLRRHGIDPAALNLEQFAALARQSPAERQRAVQDLTEAVQARLRRTGGGGKEAASSRELSVEEYQERLAQLERRFEQELSRVPEEQAPEPSKAGEKASWWRWR